MTDTRSFDRIVRDARLRLLKMHYESGVGHVGGNLSALDILLCVYHKAMTPHDVFILSKGHAAGALYVTLFSLGILSDDDLRQFHKDGTLLSGHPPPAGIPAIPFATGSLGHGLSLAAGMALAKKLKGEPGRVLCLTSDGEWNEGSSWEALAFVVTQGLDNLLLIVDANGLQGFGRTKDVMRLDPLAAKFAAYGLATREVKGHDHEAIGAALRQGNGAIVAHTVKGHGVSFMENRLEWHYLPLSEDQYRRAVREVNGECETFSASRS
ncbi:MAG: transketolase [Isosphaeraceae bacterium]|nr:transketolase [Isosphaeraceae bacterium]